MNPENNNIMSEGEIFLQTFISFKNEYLNLHNSYLKCSSAKKYLENKIKVLENSLILIENDSLNSTIVTQQEKIIQFLKDKSDCASLKGSNHNLQQEVGVLQEKLRRQKLFYDNEIQNILEKTSNQIKETRKNVENQVNARIRQSEKNYGELSQKNEELVALLQIIEVETENKISKVELNYKEEVNRLHDDKKALESEYKMLQKKYQNQEELFKEKLKYFENENKIMTDYLKSFKRDKNDKRNSDLMQTDEILEDTGNNPPPVRKLKFEKLSPYITDENMTISSFINF